MTFELGINYWPRRSAMYMWRELDPGEVREDMSHIADMGFDVVRIFALTRDFLPGARSSAAMVERLLQVIRIAADARLRVVPTLIVLNMSGRIWWPDWMLRGDGQPRDLFEDLELLAAQERLVSECATALKGDASIRAIDITNEIDDAQRPRTREAGRRWCERLTRAVKEASPGTSVQIGAHLPSLTRTNNMRVDDIAAIADEDVMHAYPLYYDGARSFLDPELVPFSCALTAGLSQRGRPTLMQEFGLCTAPKGAPGQTITDDFLGQPRPQYLASEEEGEEYYAAVLERLVATGAAGAYAWCYADYHPSLFVRPPFDTAIRERTFGLVRADGTEKPATRAFRALRARRDRDELRPGAIPPVLDVTVDEYYRDPNAHFDRLYAAWVSR